MTKASATKDHNHLFRIMTMDGGGIYGLFTVLMLKQLCNADPNFLKDGCVDLFAGTSAGGLNALLLAKYDNPREAIESGEMERFYSEQNIFANKNPVNLFMSNMGLRPYLGTEEYMSVLKKYFGDMTLGDLKQHVLITMFNWAGSEADGKNRKWKPKLFENYDANDPDCKLLVRDVAFASTTPTFLRAIWSGGNDGGIFAPNPTMCAVTKVIKEIFKAETQEKIPARANQDWYKMIYELFSRDYKQDTFGKSSVLNHISVLSLGVGNTYPYMDVGTEEWGMMQWMMGIWNPAIRQWVMPMNRMQFEPSIEAVNYQAAELLNRDYDIVLGDGKIETYYQSKGYHRLSPEVLPISMGIANMALRNNPVFFQYLTGEIYKAAGNAESTRQLGETYEWLKTEKWFVPETWMCDLI
ncbi:MAG: patatin-like phospholipase family protein [Desulfobacterales bacterium]|nr:patatin-like phospholipase family protein [Desulfobacterales bacterium]